VSAGGPLEGAKRRWDPLALAHEELGRRVGARDQHAADVVGEGLERSDPRSRSLRQVRDDERLDRAAATDVGAPRPGDGMHRHATLHERAGDRQAAVVGIDEDRSRQPTGVFRRGR